MDERKVPSLTEHSSADMKKVLIVFGTRPEAVKMAPVVREFKKHGTSFDTRVCVTAQHREMLDQVLMIFDLHPDYDLDIMKTDQDLFDITSNILTSIKPVLDSFQPDIVLVHGDTTTTMATSLAAFYNNVTIGHVEAGLRTYNLHSPWPEELNRQLTDRMTKYFFVPTRKNRDNLLSEHLPGQSIVVTGNTVIDALFWVLGKINNNPSLQSDLCSIIDHQGYNIDRGRKIILVTGHRRENFGEGLLHICNAIKEVAISNYDVDVVYPVHLNPNVRKPANAILKGVENVHLIDPLGYEAFVYLMSKSYVVLTDSGGVQEEAPSLGKPVLVMRNTTERSEAVDAGTVKLVGTDRQKIVSETQRLLDDQEAFNEMARAHNPYGDGQASTRIVNYLKEN